MSAEEPTEWLSEPEGLPPRPRLRLLTPASVTLLSVLMIACGFVAGVLVEKGQSSSTTSSGAGGAGGTGLAARFAGLRGGQSSGGATTGSTPGAAGSGFGGFAGPGGGTATVGQVAFIQGGTLYVTNTQGNTVKVTTSPGSAVTKTVKASLESVHPGETVVVTGTPGAHGAISAQSIRVGVGAGGLAGLFGGAGSRGSAGSSGSGAAASGAGEPALFGRGG